MFSITRMFHFTSCTLHAASISAICMNVRFHLSQSGLGLKGGLGWLRPQFWSIAWEYVAAQILRLIYPQFFATSSYPEGYFDDFLE